jgi:hypothetical protein
LAELRTSDDYQHRSSDEPVLSSARDADRRRFQDHGPSRRPPGDQMWIRANLQMRRDHRLLVRQQSDGAMPEPVHVDDPRTRDHRHDQTDGQNHG